MGQTYTPGLRVSKKAIISKKRILPMKGEVLKKVGEKVSRDEIVAEAFLKGKPFNVNVVNQLGITPQEINNYMLKKIGDKIEKGEVLAETRPFIKFLRARVVSPATGVIESISSITGQVLCNEPPRPVQMKAFVDGTIKSVIPGEGVEVESKCTFVQGIFGVGGETNGELVFVVNSPAEVLDPSLIHHSHAGKILVGGAFASSDAIKKAIECKVAGLIIGGIRDKDLRDLLGYDLGVAITGHEDLGTTIILTEGFGEIAMADRTYKALKDREGSIASISGATQIRAGVIRPEIIIPFSDTTNFKEDTSTTEKDGVQIGDQVRIIRKPHFGLIGIIKGLPAELKTVESETKVRVMEIELPSKEIVTVPRANTEIIEE